MRLFATVHIFSLVYIVAALVFWGISLQKQSLRIYEEEKRNLASQLDSMVNPLEYAHGLEKIEKRRDTRTKQYLGEGITFLLVIFIGAAVVYSSFRRSQRLSRQQHNFMLSVTHELKSPIAALKLNLQTLQRHKLKPEQEDKVVERCIQEIDRLNDLSSNMLIATQMEGRQFKPTREKLSLSSLVEKSLPFYESRFPGRVQAHIHPDVFIRGDETLLELAINNLVENAIKYSPADQEIEIRLETRKKRALFQVKDHGPGIPESEKKKIFQKFYRIGNEETRKHKGTGLGLYLTHQIVQSMRGKINLRHRSPHGSVFELSFPLHTA